MLTPETQESSLTLSLLSPSTCHQLSDPIKSPLKYFSNSSTLYPYYQHVIYPTIISLSTNLFSTLQTEYFWKANMISYFAVEKPSVAFHYPGNFCPSNKSVTLDPGLCMCLLLVYWLLCPELCLCSFTSTSPNLTYTHPEGLCWNITFFLMASHNFPEKVILQIHTSRAPCTLPLVTRVSFATH